MNTKKLIPTFTLIALTLLLAACGPRAGEVKGTLVTDTGAPAAGYTLALCQIPEGGNTCDVGDFAIFVRLTNDDGTFTFTDIKAGTYYLVVGVPGMARSNMQPLMNMDGEPVSFELTEGQGIDLGTLPVLSVYPN